MFAQLNLKHECFTLFETPLTCVPLSVVLLGYQYVQSVKQSSDVQGGCGIKMNGPVDRKFPRRLGCSELLGEDRLSRSVHESEMDADKRKVSPAFRWLKVSVRSSVQGHRDCEIQAQNAWRFFFNSVNDERYEHRSFYRRCIIVGKHWRKRLCRRIEWRYRSLVCLQFMIGWA